MMMKRYAFAIDLDGTALNSHGQLSAYTKELFQRMIEKGHVIVVASGRSLESLPEEIRTFPGIRYAITSNGAAIHDMREKRILKKSTLSRDAVRKIMELTKEDHIVYETFIEGHGFAEAEFVKRPQDYNVTSEGGIRYIQSTRKPVEGMETFIDAHTEELDCIDLILKNLEDKEIIRKKLAKQISDILITTSVARLIEIADIDAGKGKAFAWLMERLGIPIDDTAAFGNAENDIDMLKTASVGYAVANADKECLIEADEVVSSNDNDGVAEGILHFMSLKKGIKDDKTTGYF